VFESCEAFYRSDLQGFWSLLAAPALFLAWLAGPGRRRAAAAQLPGAGFVLAWSAVFAAQSLLDLLATGPLSRSLPLPAAARTGVQLFFVLVGDLRVFLLVMVLAGLPHPFVRALAWSLVVPGVAGGLHFGVIARLAPGVPDQNLWLVYEVAFAALCLWLAAGPLPRWTAAAPPGRLASLRCCLAYVVAYYALWAGSDVLILAGVDAGWCLRALPNQLYYAFCFPFVYFAFFSRRPPAAPARGSNLERLIVSK
jgi:hypothetical protein